MSVWALVPQKCFGDSKSRLRPVLSDRARTQFAQAVFDHTVGVLTRVVDDVLVCTDAPDVEIAAASHCAATLRDPPRVDTLSTVVDAGLAELKARGAREVLVVMPDLPRLTAADVRQLVGALASHDVVLVRAHDGQHTNALGLSPPGRLTTAFGRFDSFQAHLRAAARKELRVSVLDNPRIAFDVDSPEDHVRFLRTMSSHASGASPLSGGAYRRVRRASPRAVRAALTLGADPEDPSA